MRTCQKSWISEGAFPSLDRKRRWVWPDWAALRSLRKIRQPSAPEQNASAAPGITAAPLVAGVEAVLAGSGLVAAHAQESVLDVGGPIAAVDRPFPRRADQQDRGQVGREWVPCVVHDPSRPDVRPRGRAGSSGAFRTGGLIGDMAYDAS